MRTLGLVTFGMLMHANSLLAWTQIHATGTHEITPIGIPVEDDEDCTYGAIMAAEAQLRRKVEAICPKGYDLEPIRVNARVIMRSLETMQCKGWVADSYQCR